MEKYSEYIVDYLYDDMNEHQRKDFEKLMASDAELAAEVEEQRYILKQVHARLVYQEAMDDPRRKEIDKSAKKAVKRYKQEQMSRSIGKISTGRIVFRLISVAAGLVILFVLNTSTGFKTPLRGVMVKGGSYFVTLWRML